MANRPFFLRNLSGAEDFVLLRRTRDTIGREYAEPLRISR